MWNFPSQDIAGRNGVQGRFGFIGVMVESGAIEGTFCGVTAASGEFVAKKRVKLLIDLSVEF